MLLQVIIYLPFSTQKDAGIPFISVFSPLFFLLNQTYNALASTFFSHSLFLLDR